MGFKINLFEKKKGHSCCNIKIEEVKADRKTESCCDQTKLDGKADGAK